MCRVGCSSQSESRAGSICFRTRRSTTLGILESQEGSKLQGYLHLGVLSLYYDVWLAVNHAWVSTLPKAHGRQVESHSVKGKRKAFSFSSLKEQSWPVSENMTVTFLNRSWIILNHSQLFKGKFFVCIGEDTRNITNRSDCHLANYKWVRHKYNFDNLGQVRSELDSS